jgi:hypothetical protein
MFLFVFISCYDHVHIDVPEHVHARVHVREHVHFRYSIHVHVNFHVRVIDRKIRRQ